MVPEKDDRSTLRELADEIFGAGVWTQEVPSRPLSSMDIMRFLMGIERQFRISVPDGELRAENFGSFSAVLHLIARNRGSEA